MWSSISRLLAVETEKAVVEIPSPQAGHIGRLLAKVGEHVKVGAPVLEFEEGAHAESGTVMGQLAGATIVPSTPPSHGAAAKTVIGASTPRAPAVRASPAVRARARELALDLSQVTPSGPDKTITLADLASRSVPHRE